MRQKHSDHSKTSSENLKRLWDLENFISRHITLQISKNTTDILPEVIIYNQSLVHHADSFYLSLRKVFGLYKF